MNRRLFLQRCLSSLMLLGIGDFMFPRLGFGQTPAADDKVVKSDAEWKKILTPQQYHILRERGTELPYSSPLEKEHRKGTFSCAACDLALFSSATKFESGTGWPSFYESLPNAVRTLSDYELAVPRIEVRCRRCDGHLGHVFDDGPPPTGKRYCMNGIALKFLPAV